MEPPMVATAPSPTGNSTPVVHSGVGSRGSSGGSLGGPVTNTNEHPKQPMAAKTTMRLGVARAFDASSATTKSPAEITSTSVRIVTRLESLVLHGAVVHRRRIADTAGVLNLAETFPDDFILVA